MDLRPGVETEQHIGADGGAVGPQRGAAAGRRKVQTDQALIQGLGSSHVQTTVGLEPQQAQWPEPADDEAAAETAVGELEQTHIQPRLLQLSFQLLNSLEPVERSHRRLHFLSGPTLPWAACCE